MPEHISIRSQCTARRLVNATQTVISLTGAPSPSASASRLDDRKASFVSSQAAQRPASTAPCNGQKCSIINVQRSEAFCNRTGFFSSFLRVRGACGWTLSVYICSIITVDNFEVILMTWVDIRHRMVPLRILYIVILTNIFKVTQLEMLISRKR